MRKINTWSGRRLVAVAACSVAPVMAAIGLAGPAAASGCGQNCVAASATVNSTLTLAVSTTAFSYGAGNAGATLGSDALSTSSPTFVGATVTTNSPGYSLTVQGTDFGPGFPASAQKLSSSLNGTPEQSDIALNESTPTAVAGTSTMSQAGGDTIVSDWQVGLPGNAPGGTFTSDLTFVAVAS